MNSFNQSILIILYSILSLIIIIKNFSEINKNGNITIKNFFELYYFIVYGLTPIFLVSKINDGNIHYFTSDIGYYYLLFFFTFIFYFFYVFASKIHLKNKENVQSHHFNIDTSSDSFFYVSLLISIIGIGALLLWTKAFGKPWDIIQYASAIRSGRSPIYNKFTFVKPFCGFCVIGFYNNIIMLKKTKHKFFNILFLIINLFFSIIFLLGNDSRMFMIIFFLTIFLYYKNDNLKINIKNSVLYLVVFVLTLTLLGNLDSITYYIRNGKTISNNSESIKDVFQNEFGYTYRNGINVLYLYDNHLLPKIHIFKDIKNIAMFLVPRRYKTNNESLTQLNTSYYNSRGSIPTDIITASIYKFHLLGIIIMPFLIVIILNYLEKIFRKYQSNYMKLIYNLVGCNICLRFIAYYDLSNNLLSGFYIIFSALLVCIVCAKKNKNEYDETAE